MGYIKKTKSDELKFRQEQITLFQFPTATPPFPGRESLVAFHHLYFIFYFILCYVFPVSAEIWNKIIQVIDSRFILFSLNYVDRITSLIVLENKC